MHCAVGLAGGPCCSGREARGSRRTGLVQCPRLPLALLMGCCLLAATAAIAWDSWGKTPRIAAWAALDRLWSPGSLCAMI